MRSKIADVATCADIPLVGSDVARSSKVIDLLSLFTSPSQGEVDHTLVGADGGRHQFLEDGVVFPL
jgi:hypothetical protein